MGIVDGMKIDLNEVLVKERQRFSEAALALGLQMQVGFEMLTALCCWMTLCQDPWSGSKVQHAFAATRSAARKCSWVTSSAQYAQEDVPNAEEAKKDGSRRDLAALM